VTRPEPKAIAEAFDRLRDPAMAERLGGAGNALVRDVVPAWPEIVTRLLDR